MAPDSEWIEKWCEFWNIPALRPQLRISRKKIYTYILVRGNQKKIDGIDVCHHHFSDLVFPKLYATIPFLPPADGRPGPLGISLGGCEPVKNGRANKNLSMAKA